jgi:hypothetical protein
VRYRKGSLHFRLGRADKAPCLKKDGKIVLRPFVNNSPEYLKAWSFPDGATTLSMMTYSIATLSIMTRSITVLSITILPFESKA